MSSALTEEESIMLARLKEKKRQGSQADEQKRTDERRKRELEVSKALASLKFTEDGPYGDLDDSGIRDGVRSVYKGFGDIENRIEARIREIPSSMWKSNKKEMDFLKDISALMTASSINTHNLLSNLPLRSRYDDDFKEHDILFSQQQELSKKRQKTISSAPLIVCSCKKTPACVARCPCRKANKPCSAFCRCGCEACENSFGNTARTAPTNTTRISYE
jgi:hypothetical protein